MGGRDIVVLWYSEKQREHEGDIALNAPDGNTYRYTKHVEGDADPNKKSVFKDFVPVLALKRETFVKAEKILSSQRQQRINGTGFGARRLTPAR